MVRVSGFGVSDFGACTSKTPFWNDGFWLWGFWAVWANPDSKTPEP